MSTVLVDPTEMMRLGAPRLIHNDAELEQYTSALFRLTALDPPSIEHMDAIELLSLLIRHYLASNYPLSQSDPADMLRYLMGVLDSSPGYRVSD